MTAGQQYIGLLKRLPGICIPHMEVSVARERLLVNPLTRLEISGFDDDFKRFIWPMTMMRIAAGVVRAECLAVYQLLKPAPDPTLIEALETIDEEPVNQEINIWQYLFVLASARQTSHRLLASTTLGFIRGIDGMMRMVGGTMRNEGLLFTAVLPEPEEEESNRERSPGDRLLCHAPAQQEMMPFLSLLSLPPQREEPSVVRVY